MLKVVHKQTDSSRLNALLEVFYANEKRKKQRKSVLINSKKAGSDNSRHLLKPDKN